jgi:purine-binding chemotaxis protein CheW
VGTFDNWPDDEGALGTTGVRGRVYAPRMNVMSDTRAPAGAEAFEFLVVRAADELYGLPGAAVREVVRWRTPTPVPGAPPVIPGIVGQRGVVLPVVDLRLALGLVAAPPDRAARLVVVQHDSIDMALFVDAVLDLVALAPTECVPPPAGLDPARARLLAAVARHGDRPLAIINLAALVAAVQGEG